MIQWELQFISTHWPHVHLQLQKSHFLKIEGYRGIDVAYTAHLQLLTSRLNVFRYRLLLWCGVSWQKQRAAVSYVLWFIYCIVQFKINLLSLLLFSTSFSLSLHSVMLLFAFGCIFFLFFFNVQLKDKWSKCCRLVMVVQTILTAVTEPHPMSSKTTSALMKKCRVGSRLCENCSLYLWLFGARWKSTLTDYMEQQGFSWQIQRDQMLGLLSKSKGQSLALNEVQ